MFIDFNLFHNYLFLAGISLVTLTICLYLLWRLVRDRKSLIRDIISGLLIVLILFQVLIIPVMIFPVLIFLIYIWKKSKGNFGRPQIDRTLIILSIVLSLFVIGFGFPPDIAMVSTNNLFIMYDHYESIPLDEIKMVSINRDCGEISCIYFYEVIHDHGQLQYATSTSYFKKRKGLELAQRLALKINVKEIKNTDPDQFGWVRVGPNEE